MISAIKEAVKAN